MNSLFLRVSSGLIVPIMLLIALLLVVRGHNSPGGGFVGALVAVAAISLDVLARDVKATRFIKSAPIAILLGTLSLITCIILARVNGYPLLTAIWYKTTLWGYKIKVGTPLLFDFGIFFIIFGSISSLIVTLVNE